MVRLFILLVALVCPIPVLAVISISTAGIPSIDGVAADPVSYNQWVASSISSDDEDTTVDLMIEAINVRMQVSVPNQNMFVGITTSSGFRPDMSNVVAVMDVAPLTDSPTLNTPMNFRLTVDESIAQAPVLSAGQDYWLVVGATAIDPDETPQTGLYYWSFASSSAPVEAPSGWSVPSLIALGSSGGSSWTPSGGTPYTFDIEVSEVPELASFTQLLALCALSVAFSSRNRRRS